MPEKVEPATTSVPTPIDTAHEDVKAEELKRQDISASTTSESPLEPETGSVQSVESERPREPIDVSRDAIERELTRVSAQLKSMGRAEEQSEEPVSEPEPQVPEAEVMERVEEPPSQPALPFEPEPVEEVPPVVEVEERPIALEAEEPEPAVQPEPVVEPERDLTTDGAEDVSNGASAEEQEVAATFGRSRHRPKPRPTVSEPTPVEEIEDPGKPEIKEEGFSTEGMKFGRTKRKRTRR